MRTRKLGKKDIDLLSIYNVKTEPSKYASMLKYAAFPAVMVIGCVSFFGFQTFRIHNLNAETDTINQQITTLTKQMENDPNVKKNEKYIKDLATLNQLKQLHKNLESYPQMSQYTFDQILLASDLKVSVTSLSYTRESQVITLQIESADVNDTENFVRKLKTSNVFASVDYDGYTSTERNVEKETTATTEDKASDNKSDTDATKALLEALLNKNTSDKNTTESKETTIVYTSTVLCTLK